MYCSDRGDAVDDINARLGAIDYSNIAGVIITFGGTKTPNNYAICDGAEVSQLMFPELYTAIGDIWAYKNPTTQAGTFRLPPAQLAITRATELPEDHPVTTTLANPRLETGFGPIECIALGRQVTSRVFLGVDLANNVTYVDGFVDYIPYNNDDFELNALVNDGFSSDAITYINNSFANNVASNDGFTSKETFYANNDFTANELFNDGFDLGA